MALLSCRRAATISEWGLGAMLLVAAAGAAHSPRLHAVKDSACDAPAAACFRDHQGAAAQTIIKAEASASKRVAAEIARAPKPAGTPRPKG